MSVSAPTFLFQTQRNGQVPPLSTATAPPLHNGHALPPLPADQGPPPASLNEMPPPTYENPTYENVQAPPQEGAEPQLPPLGGTEPQLPPLRAGTLPPIARPSAPPDED